MKSWAVAGSPFMPSASAARAVMPKVRRLEIVRILFMACTLWQNWLLVDLGKDGALPGSVGDVIHSRAIGLRFLHRWRHSTALDLLCLKFMA